MYYGRYINEQHAAGVVIGGNECRQSDWVMGREFCVRISAWEALFNAY